MGFGDEIMRGIINGKMITENTITENKVLLFDKKILGIVEQDELSDYGKVELINAKGKYVSPGLIDIHIHGIGGHDTMDGSLEALQQMSIYVAKNGVTGFLPTTMTLDQASICKSLDIIKILKDAKPLGARILGAHMEGPFINPKYKGAQREQYIIKPNYEFIKDYTDIIKIITLAPEMDENFAFLDAVRQHEEIVLSIGHSNATYEEALEAIAKGVSHATHTFNAMSPFHHRKPGVVGAILNSDISCELIADKIHVHPGNFQLLINSKGVDRVVLISDSMRAACMKNGQYGLGGQTVNVNSDSARLKDGTLAGSVLTLNKAIKNVLENTDLTLCEAVNMASLYPAQVIGMSKQKGSIEIGKDADLVIFDADFAVQYTWVEGEIIKF